METVQWIGIFMCVFAAIVGEIGVVLDKRMNLSSHVPDGLMLAGRNGLIIGMIVMFVGAIGSTS